MKITTWQTLIPSELKRQLTEFERRFEVVRSELGKLKLNPVLSLFELMDSRVTRTVTIPDRDVDLSEKHALDPWVVTTTDLLTSNNSIPEFQDGFLVNSVLAATQARYTEAHHPGCITVTTPATLGSGVMVTAGPFILEGGEYLCAVFKTSSAFADRRILVGVFQGVTAFNEPIDGCYLWLDGSATMVGKTSTSSTRSTTATSITLDVNTWYTAVVKVDSTKTSVTYSIYSDAGVKLWTDSLNSNIPTTTPNQYGGIKFSVTTATALTVGTVDYVQLRVGGPGRNLNRYIGSSEELFL